jgi:predicted enzyme related to lactoylglutathione lyase/ketosteroid isomerase-like protein
MSEPPLFRKIDAIEIAVPTIDDGLAWYRDRLGHELVWRTDTAAGLRMPYTDAEIVLQTERPNGAVDVLVDSADEAAAAIVRAGGRLVTEPFDIAIGRCAVIEDPWGNRLVLLDARKGTYETDTDGRILGVTPQAQDDEANTLREVERQRLAALVHGDLETARAVHADDYELITPGGATMSKEEYLGDVASGAIRYVVFEPASDIRVRVLGDSAIVRYRARIDIRFPGDGRDEAVVWHTDYYERRDGQWRAVWSHATRAAS